MSFTDPKRHSHPHPDPKPTYTFLPVSLDNSVIKLRKSSLYIQHRILNLSTPLRTPPMTTDHSRTNGLFDDRLRPTTTTPPPSRHPPRVTRTAAVLLQCGPLMVCGPTRIANGRSDGHAVVDFASGVDAERFELRKGRGKMASALKTTG